MQAYHDREWGVPLHDDRGLFELLTLEGAQAGLSWSTILRRREAYRDAFADFDVRRVAAMSDAELEQLMANAGIIRNRQKIVSTRENARRVIELYTEGESLDGLVWSFVNGHPVVHGLSTLAELPATSAEASTMSKTLKKRGFGFVGPTICYAFMQAAGLVNDHVRGCFRYAELVGA